MDVLILTVGRLKAGPEREICERYLERARKAGPKLGLRAFRVEELGESRAARAADRIAEEGAALRQKLDAGDRVTVLDEHGGSLDSAAFAAALARDAASVPRSVFVIGGPDGLSEDLKGAAAHSLSFGRLTIAHQLVRMLLLEQLYRATTILSGHPYHRA